MRVLTLILCIAVGAACGYGVSSTLRVPAAPRWRAGRPQGDPIDAAVSPAPVVELSVPLDAQDPQHFALAAALAALPMGSYSRGRGSLTGTVLDSQGDPLAGVQVTCIIRGLVPGVEAKPLYKSTLLEYVLQEAEQFNYDASMLCRSDTDEAGRFMVRGLTDGEYHLEFRKEHFALVAAEGSSIRGLHAGDDVQVLARPTAPVTFDIRLPDGTAPQVAFVHLGHMGDQGRFVRQYWYLWEPNDPVIPAPVEYPVFRTVTWEGHSSDIEAVTWSHGEPSDLLSVLGDSNWVRVRIDGVDPERGDRFSAIALSAADDSEGRTVSLTAPHYSASLYHDPHLRSPEVRLRLRDTELDRVAVAGDTAVPTVVFQAPAAVDEPEDLPGSQRSMLVRVTRADGVPVLDATFGIGTERSWSSGGMGTLLPDGRYRVEWEVEPARGMGTGGVGEMNLPAWVIEQMKLLDQGDGDSPQQLGIYSESGSTFVDLGTDLPAELDVRLAPTSEVTFLVENLVGHPFHGRLRLHLERRDGSGREKRLSADVDAVGRARMTSVAPGSYALSFSSSVLEGCYGGVAIREIQIADGPSEHGVRIPEVYRLSVLGGHELDQSGIRLTSRSDRDFNEGSATFEDGVAEFPYLLPGTYSISTGDRSMSVDVQGDITVRLDTLGSGTIELQTGDRAALSDLGLRVGDRLVGFGGAEMVDLDLLKSAMRLLPSQSGASVLIERNGTRIDLELDQEQLTRFAALNWNLVER